MSSTPDNPAVPLSLFQVPYSPPSLGSLENSTSTAKMIAEISSDHFAHWLTDQNHQLQNPLHPHFCTTLEDRTLVINNGISDIRDVVCIFFQLYRCSSANVSHVLR